VVPLILAGAKRGAKQKKDNCLQLSSLFVHPPSETKKERKKNPSAEFPSSCKAINLLPRHTLRDGWTRRMDSEIFGSSAKAAEAVDALDASYSIPISIARAPL